MDWYAHAEDYDVWFSWDPTQERDFVLDASRRYGKADPRRILEPMCGPGRLLRSMPGWAVGLDLNPAMLRVAARTNPVFRADAGRFAVRRGAFDLAFNLIDSFRHLRNEDAAAAHLRCVAEALTPGAVYVLGLEINGDIPGDVARDAWTGERDGVEVTGFVEGLGDADPDSRQETMRVVYARADGPEREFFHTMRTYTRRQIEDLIDTEGSFEIAAVTDRNLDIEHPLELSEIAGSAVLVLRRE